METNDSDGEPQTDAPAEAVERTLNPTPPTLAVRSFGARGSAQAEPGRRTVHLVHGSGAAAERAVSACQKSQRQLAVERLQELDPAHHPGSFGQEGVLAIIVGARARRGGRGH
ncbi:MAG: hypothetical protein SangKO_066710 [Sandaracinaceae bacterium]